MRIGIDAHMVGQRETGNETYVVGVVRALRQLDSQNEYRVFVLDRPGPFAELETSRFQCEVIRPANSFVRIPLSMPFMAWRHSLDVLHATYIAPPLCSCPTLVAVHDISFVHFPEFFSPRVRLLLSTLVPLSINRAARVLTLSEHTKRELVAHYGIPEDKITVTYAAASDIYRPITDREASAQVCEKYQIAGPFVLAGGNIQPRKNLSRLIEAYAQLRGTEQIPHKLVIVGQSNWRASEVYQTVRQHGLDVDVIFTGYVPEEDLCLLYNAAQVFVYPSLYEGFGLSPLEAMACGTPTATSNTASLPEVVGDAALTFDPYQVDDMAAVLRTVIADAKLREQLARKGLDQVRRFSWERTALRILAACEEVHQRPTRHRRQSRLTD